MDILEELKIYGDTPNMPDLVYDFVQSYIKDMNQPKDYGNGELVYMIEAHVIKYIAENPGVTVTDISNYWKRTKSTVSIQITKLEKNGYVTRKQDETNLKRYNIYLTEKGEILNKLHHDYDTNNIEIMMKYLLEKHTMEEIIAFYSVMDSLKGYLEE